MRRSTISRVRAGLTLRTAVLTLLAAGAVSMGARSASVSAQQVRGSGAEGVRPACAEARGETRMLAYGWNHVVIVTNGCTAPITCQVASDVDPTPISVRVPAGATQETLTRRGSPATVFVARAECELDR